MNGYMYTPNNIIKVLYIVITFTLICKTVTSV